MRYNTQTKEQAAHLWKIEGYSLGDIAKTLCIPRTTVHYWVRDIPVNHETPTAKQVERIEKMRARQRAATAANVAKCAARRRGAYEAAYKNAPRLLEDLEIRDFVVLYLAEGYRKDKNSVALGNSNPRIIEFSF